MARGKKKDDDGLDSNNWLTTYTDLMTLLLTFFVLLLTMSTIDEVRTRKALESLLGAFGILEGGRATIGDDKGRDYASFTSPMTPVSGFDVQILKNLSMTNEVEPEITIEETKEKISISIYQRALFKPGSSEINPAIKNYLSDLATHFRQGEFAIQLKGHVGRFEEDDTEGADWPQRSWAVSAERAMALLQYFRSQGIEVERMSAHGYGYQVPVVDDLEYPGQRYKNYRVEIELKSKGDALPSTLVNQRGEERDFFNYKNFFFRMFSRSDKQAQSNED